MKKLKKITQTIQPKTLTTLINTLIKVLGHILISLFIE